MEATSFDLRARQRGDDVTMLGDAIIERPGPLHIFLADAVQSGIRGPRARSR